MFLKYLSIIEKYNKHVLALISGALISGSMVWVTLEKIHEKEILLLEKQNIDLQNRLSSTEALLRTAQQELQNNPAKIVEAKLAQKLELEKLVGMLDTEIEKKKMELARNSPVTYGGQKDDGYLRVENELRSLYEQRNAARQQLIELVGR